MATLDLTMVLKLNDKASRQMRRFNKTLDQTKKKLEAIGRQQTKNAQGRGRGAGRGAGGGGGGIGLAGVGLLAAGASNIGAGIKGITGDVDKLTGSFRNVDAAVGDVKSGFKKTNVEAKFLGGVFREHGAKVADVAELHLKAGKSFDFITRAIKRNGDALNKSGTRWDKFRRSVKKTGDTVRTNKLKFAALFAVIALGINHIIKVGREFETLRATLSSVIPQSDNLGDAFAFLQNLATKLPSTLQEVTTAFIRMQALGLAPTEDKLISFANTAAASGKSVLQFVEAVADAVVGENERLKEFGIKAKVNGDKVAFTFRGLTDEVDNNARSISEFLVSIGSDAESGFKSAGAFAGAAEKQMKTLDGAISNLGVSTDKLSDNLFQAFAPALKAVVAVTDSLVNVLNEAFVGVRKFIVFTVGGFDQLIIKSKAWVSSIGATDAETKKINATRDAALKISAKTIASLIDELDALVDVEAATKRYNKVLNDRAKGEIDTTITIEGLAHETQKYSDFIRELVNTLRDETAATENAFRAQSDLDELFQDGLITSAEYIAGIEKLNEILGVELPESLSELNAFWQQAFSNMQDDLGEFFGQAALRKFDNFKDAMQSLASDFAKTIGRMVAQWLAAKVLTGGFGLFGIDVGGRGFADGGRPPVNLPSVVGERGPELFVPDTAGTIVPNEAMGGKTVQINVHSVDGTDTMRVLEKSKREITEMVFGTQATFNMGTA